MLNLIREFGSAFRISFSISGTALDQMETYTPEVIESFRQLAETGQVEFIAETYAHSLAALGNKEEFIRQTTKHAQKIESLFGKYPVTFRNTELIYSDKIGEAVAEMGFQTMLTEGAKHVLGWKSPNYIYCNKINPKLKVLLRNYQLSDDLTFRFSNQDWSEWPLTTEKFVKWLNNIDKKEEVVNLFIDYETIGEHQWKETGIFDFFNHLPSEVLTHSDFRFETPEVLSRELQPVSAISVPHPISWADEERDLTAWLGNELQDEAFSKLYSISGEVAKCPDPAIQRDWLYLQTSNHFYYMCTKWFSSGEVHKYFNPYGSPYEAFINYMNVMSDFMIRVEDLARQQSMAITDKDLTEKKPESIKPVKKTPQKSKAVVEKTGAVKATKKSTPAEPKKVVAKNKKTK
jgi:alpha-amylase